jgi:trimeric autotransporter adhesin
MNTIYRIVWNVTLGKWVVASELAKGRKKKSSLKTAMLSLAVVGAMAGMGASNVYAADVSMPSCVAGEDPHATGCVPTSAEQLITPFYQAGGGDDNGNATNVAIGQGAVAGTPGVISSATAIGIGAHASALGSVAIGRNSESTGASGIAIGQEASSKGTTNGVIAIGFRADADTGATPGAWAAISIGTNSDAVGDGASALGDSAQAIGDRTSAFGRDARSTQVGGTAFGADSRAAATDGTAIGRGATVQAAAAGAVAIGAGSVADRSNTVSVGSSTSTRQIINVAAGVQDTDAVNVSQLRASGLIDDGGRSVAAVTYDQNADGTPNYGSVTMAGPVSTDGGKTGGTKITNVAQGAVSASSTEAVNGAQLHETNANLANATRYFKANGLNDGTDDAKISGANAVSVGSNANAVGQFSIAMGNSSVADRAVNSNGNGAVAIGNSSYAGASSTNGINPFGSVAVGSNASAYAGGSVAIGSGARASVSPTTGAAGVDANFGVSIGTDASTANGGAAIGYLSSAGGNTATAIGIRSNAAAADAIAMGNRAGVDATATGGLALGAASSVGVNAIGSVALGAGSSATQANTVSLGTSANTRRVVDMTAGVADTDAVNVSQLKPVVAALGGGAAFNATTGAVTGPTYNVGGNTYNNVGDALGNIDGRVTQNTTNITNIDGRVTQNTTNITNLLNGTAGLVQQATPAGTITVGAATGGTLIDMRGTDGDRRITGVASAQSDNEAVNLSQLNSAVADVAAGASRYFKADGLTDDSDDAVVTGDKAVAIGAGSIADRASTVSVGSVGNERAITNVAAGTQDTDAVNVSQLKDAGLIGDDGKTNAAVTYDQNADGTPNYGSVTMAGPVSIDGGKTGGTKITNVAQGAVDETSTDAVNGAQLHETNANLTNATRYFKADGLNDGTDDAVASGANAVAMGAGAMATASNAVALGAGSVADRANSVSVGSAGAERQVTNVAAGTQDTDAVNVSQLKDAGLIGDDGKTNAAVTYDQNADGTPNYGSVTMAGPVSIDGGKTGGTKITNVAQGAVDETSTDAVNGAQLHETNANLTNATRYFKADGLNDGTDDAVASGANAVAMGAGAMATASNAVALGAGSVADRANSVSVGSAGAERQITNVAAGTEDTDAVNVSQLKAAGLVGDDGSTLDAVVYDLGSSRGSVTFGGLNGTKLTNVMAGLVSSTSTDAINGSQLWILQDQVDQLGDRVTYIENHGAPGGEVPPADGGRDPAFVANGDGGPASASGKDSVAAGTGASAKADNSVAIGAGSVADRADTVSVGSVGAERQITNVAAGTQRTDAANWGQVQDALATANRYTDDRFDSVNRRIGDVQRQANKGIAASAALINVTPYIAGKTVLNAGVANYRGESALGVGVSRWNDTGRVNFNAGMSAAAGDSPIFRMGVGVVLGD